MYSSGGSKELWARSFTVVSDRTARTARAFNRSGATRAVALDISKHFDRVWHAGLLHKSKSYGISGQIFGIISSLLSNRRLRVVLDGKSSQEYPVNAANVNVISIAKTASKKIGALIRSMKFLSPEAALYLYKSTIWPWMEYCCQVWAGAPSCYLELVDTLQKRICRTVCPSLAVSLEPLAHRQNVAS